MKKNNILIVCIIGVFILILCLITIIGNNKVNSQIETVDDVKSMFNKIYKNLDLPELETNEINIDDTDSIKVYTGLSSNENIEKIIVSEPLMNAQAYSSVVLIVKEGSDIEQMKQEILENINMRKWICVSASDLYITNNGNVIFFVMSDKERAKAVYNGFKDYVNNSIGKELYRENNEDDIELPEETPKIVE